MIQFETNSSLAFLFLKKLFGTEILEQAVNIVWELFIIKTVFFSAWDTAVRLSCKVVDANALIMTLRHNVTHVHRRTNTWQNVLHFNFSPAPPHHTSPQRC